MRNAAPLWWEKAVKKDWIEDLVVNYTMKAIMNDEVMEQLIDTLMELQKKESTDLPLLKKQLAETEKGINNMLNAIQAGIFTSSTKQRLIDSFVNAVYLYEDKIILTFNYKDGSKTITLAEVEGSDLSVLGAWKDGLFSRLFSSVLHQPHANSFYSF